MEWGREERVGSLIREEISEIIMRRLKDPRVGFVTVTKVKVSKDLRSAKVYVSVMGSEEEIASSMDGLRNASSFIRRELGKRIRLKFLPSLKFIYDGSMDHAFRIDAILRDLKERGAFGEGADKEGDI